MKTIIKVFTLFTFFLSSLVFSSAYRETYKSDIQRQLYQLEQETQYTPDSPLDIKRKKYLKKRLKNIQSVGITKIVFTSKLKYNEPINSLSSASYKQKRIYLFTRIRNMKGEYLTHVWFKNGNLIFEKRMKVRTNTWKMWTWITPNKKYIGNWEVIIYSDDDKVIAKKRFFVTR